MPMGDAQPGTWAVFYKEPLEEPDQTLQPGLGFLTRQRSVACNFTSCKNIFSAFPNNNKKKSISPANSSTYKLAAEVRLPVC